MHYFSVSCVALTDGVLSLIAWHCEHLYTFSMNLIWWICFTTCIMVNKHSCSFYPFLTGYFFRVRCKITSKKLLQLMYSVYILNISYCLILLYSIKFYIYSIHIFWMYMTRNVWVHIQISWDCRFCYLGRSEHSKD